MASEQQSYHINNSKGQKSAVSMNSIMGELQQPDANGFSNIFA